MALFSDFNNAIEVFFKKFILLIWEFEVFNAVIQSCMWNVFCSRFRNNLKSRMLQHLVGFVFACPANSGLIINFVQ